MQFVIDHSYLIPLLPLIAAVVAGFFGARHLKERSHWPVWIAVGIAALLSLVILFGMLGGVEEGKQFFRHANWFTWIDTGNGSVPKYDPASASYPERFVATAGALIDPLSAVMLCVVCGIGFLITVFAAGYMHGEEGYFRFFAYLGLFIFSMTCLVMGENLLMLYLGWEGVGLCSYLLIGYYYEKPSAREAARKAFIVNRVGDFGFGIGIMLTFLVFGTISYVGQAGSGVQGFVELAAIYTTNAEMYASLPEWKQQALSAIPFCLMLGAFGKSAQFPLHVWLPDAMEGPTPVSALIHAATMVTAGVYMIARCSTLFVSNQTAMLTIAAIGLLTAIFAASIALRQFDLKKVFAYSTVSQLGFMFVGVGLLAPVAGVFHLVTHAFFKALLFLSSGVVMHAMAGSLDMREMSGLKRVLPKTRWLMLIGCLALAGMIPFSGFWSKDEIVVAAFLRHDVLGKVALTVLLLTAFLTAYYTFRLYFRVFEGPEMLPPEAAEALGRPHAAAAIDHRPHDAEQAHAKHDDDHAHGAGGHGAHGGHHDPEPPVMIYPLYVLAAGAVLIGLVNTPVLHLLGDFLGHSPSFFWGYNVAVVSQPTGTVEPLAFGQHDDAAHGIHWLPMLVSILVAGMGIGLAYLLHLADRAKADELAGKLRPIAWVLEAKYWVDELYQNVIVRPLALIGRAFFAFDRWVVDSLVLIVSLVPWAGGWLIKLGVQQRGYMQGYAAVMLFGIAVILLIIFL